MLQLPLFGLSAGDDLLSVAGGEKKKKEKKNHSTYRDVYTKVSGGGKSAWSVSSKWELLDLFALIEPLTLDFSTMLEHSISLPHPFLFARSSPFYLLLFSLEWLKD